MGILLTGVLRIKDMMEGSDEGERVSILDRVLVEISVVLTRS